MTEIVKYSPQAIQKYNTTKADYVYHITVGQLSLIASIEAQNNRRNGERNALLIRFIFDGCLRVSEALSVRLCDFVVSPDGWTVNVLGKGNKPRPVAISQSIAADIQSYCRHKKIESKDKLFPITRSQTWRIVTNAFINAGVQSPTIDKDRVGAVHVLRHSGAIERLRITGNPKALQDHLGHIDAQMTLRYMKTLSAQESLKINQKVEIW